MSLTEPLATHPNGAVSPAPRIVDDAFFARPTLEVARALIGCTLRHRDTAGVIVEVEAYCGDAASHHVTRPRTGAIMGTTHGRIYLYSIYGMHRCLNVTTDEHGPGAVLFRALEPTEGLGSMAHRRGSDDVRALCSGPAKLVEALAVDSGIGSKRFLDHFELDGRTDPLEIATGPRIGISAAVELPWRLALRGSRFLSRKI